jgi:hypothetical protein
MHDGLPLVQQSRPLPRFPVRDARKNTGVPLAFIAFTGQRYLREVENGGGVKLEFERLF